MLLLFCFGAKSIVQHCCATQVQVLDEYVDQAESLQELATTRLAVSAGAAAFSESALLYSYACTMCCMYLSSVRPCSVHAKYVRKLGLVCICRCFFFFLLAIIGLFYPSPSLVWFVTCLLLPLQLARCTNWGHTGGGGMTPPSCPPAVPASYVSIAYVFSLYFD